MAELSYNIVSVANLRDWIGFPGDGPTARDLSALEIIANGLTLAIENFIGRPIKARSRTDYLDGSGGREIALPLFPVVSITSLDVISATTDGSVYSSYVASDYLLDSEVGRIMLWAESFPLGRKNIKAVYSPGWATPPEAVLLAARLWGLRLFKEWNGGNAQEEILSQSLDGQTTTFFHGTMPKKVEGLLKPYRVPVLV